MPRLFYPNFEFEDELAGRPINHDVLSALRKSLADIWLAIAEPGECVFDRDGLIQPVNQRSPFPVIATLNEPQLTNRHGCFELFPWGWSESCLQFADRFGVEANAPSLVDVRQINERQYGFDFEIDHNIGLDGMAAIKTPEEFVETVTRLVQRLGDDPNSIGWILKPQLSASGRHCLRGRGLPGEQQRSWVTKRTDGQNTLFLEPHVECVREAGFQFWIDDAVRFDGCVEMITDTNGQYRGSIARPSIEPIWSDTLMWCTRLAEQIRRRGYFGPLGIDSMVYRHSDGQMKHRPVQDVNGRYTMGRVALGLRRFVERDETLVWVHCDAQRPEAVLEQLATHFPFARRIVVASSTTTAVEIRKLPVLVVVSADVQTDELLSITHLLFAG